MSIESRKQFIEKSEYEEKQLENKTEEAEKEVAAARAIIRTMEFPKDCDPIKQAVESTYTESVDNYNLNEISNPAESQKKDAENVENEAKDESAKVENGIQSIENIESNGKEIKVDLEGSKRKAVEHKGIVDEQTKKLARINQDLVATLIRSGRMRGL